MSAAIGDPATDFLVLQDVRTHFDLGRDFLTRQSKGVVKAVDGVSLTVRKGEVLGLVGESGCGKSTLSRTIMQLIRPTSGQIWLEGEELSAISDQDIRETRKNFQMIFQDPYASLNPRMTVMDTLAEAIRTRHPGLNAEEMRGRVSDLLRTVGLNPVQMKRYPHEFSGGQRQRIAIARALAPEPKLIIADEPVSALDVSIQSQILNLLKRLVREMGLTMIFISHDLSVVRYVADRIAVMYLGHIIELGSAEAVVDKPLHIYTKALMSAIPLPDPRAEKARTRIILPGDLPSPLNPPSGCVFWPRSPVEHDERLKTVPPGFAEVYPDHWAADCPFCVEKPA
ncbi:ATP-binding cassette domain-containing protein [Altererythrobacter sp. KTW20L]|uniref:ABC transporter ATP-binding protein n=1 Tax=Altererythrobacter sp. KTW20L TaxID=2942210 RepID=UPI0020BDF151|nr:oligopeptide/dipeptide ABC transporter ATP-binding protein [Altererythrobacter sp. KTW20L]MCL6250279.1 ATP-binding cassette domain-containing protein [Altererythrobacter sp. KTW20L]